MTITSDHWLSTAIRRPIAGGASMPIRRFLVIHFTAGASGESSISYWRELNNGVCAHIVIERDGTIKQCRPFNTTCGHAGRSRWQHNGKNYNGLNSCSIGIELANGGDSYPTKFSNGLPATNLPHKNGGPTKLWETYPLVQRIACEKISKLLVAHYNLDDVVGHDDIAPERKSDPGPAFPMLALRESCGFSGMPKPFQ
jgi:N-acetylmuramoyl-L-alanine amidase